MSCRHDLALGTCSECYPRTGSIVPTQPGISLDGPGAEPIQDAILLGGGVGLLPLQSGDIAIASVLDRNGWFASIRLSRDGTMRVNERVVETDEALVIGFRAVVASLLRASGYEVPSGER